MSSDSEASDSQPGIDVGGSGEQAKQIFTIVSLAPVLSEAAHEKRTKNTDNFVTV
jgi:hypothetical protein